MKFRGQVKQPDSAQILSGGVGQLRPHCNLDVACKESLSIGSKSRNRHYRHQPPTASVHAGWQGYSGRTQCQFNRRFNLRSILPRLLQVACLTKPQSRQFVQAAEVGAYSGGYMAEGASRSINCPPQMMGTVGAKRPQPYLGGP